jgi:hypothetical protein
MLTDPLPVAVVTSVDANSNLGTSAHFHLIPSIPGTATRRHKSDANGDLTISISQSSSKENAPLVTTRTLIRLDESVLDSSTGQVAKASAYVVIAIPDGMTDDAGTDSALKLLRTLVCLLNYGPGPSTEGDTFDLPLGTTATSQLTRVINGEG